MGSGRLRATFLGAVAIGRLAAAAARTDDQPLERQVVDRDWRRLVDGEPARLGTRETIDVRRQVGRFRGLDHRQVHGGFAAPGKLVGLTLWAGVVGGAWWLGSGRGRGPLAAAAQLDEFGSAVRAALAGPEDRGDVPGGDDAR